MEEQKQQLENEEFEVRDLKNPDEFTAIPNDLVDKYMRLFDGKQLEAVMDLIKQTFKAGLDYGRNESPMFAVIPMSILENKVLSANAKLLYGEIMALSKRSGKCYATNEHLANVLGLKRTTIPNLLRELSGSGLIIIDIKRDKKGTYRDIMVSFFSNGGCSNLTMRGIAKEQGQKRNRQIEINNKSIVGKADDVFLFKNKLDEMTKDKQKHIQIIALYWQIKGFNFENKEQYQAALKRELRPARQLVGYSMDRIRETIEWLSEETDINFKLETVHKYIDEDLDNIIPIKEKRNHH